MRKTAKQIWMNTRDRFTKEKRIWKSGDTQQKSAWVYLKKMSFYDKFSKPRKRVSATPKTDQTDDRPESQMSTISDTSLQISSYSLNAEGDSEADANDCPKFSEDSIDYRKKTPKRVKKNPPKSIAEVSEIINLDRH